MNSYYPKERMYWRLVIKAKFTPADVEQFMGGNGFNGHAGADFVWTCQRSVNNSLYLHMIGEPDMVETVKALLRDEGLINFR